MSPKLTALLNEFEQTLAVRFIKLLPNDNELILSLSWMTLAIQSLSESQSDIKSLFADLDLPVSQWEDKWIDVYLDNTLKLLDVCTAFISQVSRLNQGQLLLKCLLHGLDHGSSKDIPKVCLSLDNWWKHIGSSNARIDNCCSVIGKLVQSLNLPKIKNSAKGKVLMRAMYGVRVQTVLICSIIVSAFTGSAEKLTLLQVSDTCSWAEAYNILQASVARELRNPQVSKIAVKELVAVDEYAKILLALTQNPGGPKEDESVKKSISELRKTVDGLSTGLDRLSTEVDGFFRLVLSGRDALLCNLRASPDFTKSPQSYKKDLMMR